MFRRDPDHPTLSPGDAGFIEDFLGDLAVFRKLCPGLVVVSPHANNLNGAFGLIDLIDQSVLDIDPPRICPGQITYQFLVRRRVLERVSRHHVEEALSVRFEIGGRDPFGVLPSLPRVDDRPSHQPGLPRDLESGSAMPLRMESRIPGMERRKSVS